MERTHYIAEYGKIRKDKEEYIKNNPKPSLRHLNMDRYIIALESWFKEVNKYDEYMKNILDCYKNKIDLII